MGRPRCPTCPVDDPAVTDPGRVVGVVLAAGAARRFGGGKLSAPLAGRPLIARVIRTAREAGLGAIVLVVGADGDAVRAVATSELRPEDRVVENVDWSSGLASSVRIGLAAASEALPEAEAALLLLGDQPMIPAGVIGELLGASTDPSRPVVAPRYEDDAGHNPVLLRRAGWGLVNGLTGDRGLGPLMAASPELVTWIRVGGHNPDVDTRDDLARLERGIGS